MKRAIYLNLVVLLVAGLFCSAGYGQPWLGSGTEDDPYRIRTAEDMQAIGADANYWDAHFLLCADIDLGAYIGTSFNIIGISYHNPFIGVFDGDGHTVSNFTYDCDGINYIGLFRYIDDPNAEIKNLGLIAPDVNAGANVGSLAGYLRDGAISGCYVEGGSVSGRSGLGGLVGWNNHGDIQGCYSTGSVSGDRDVGGLVGYNSDGYITSCYSTGKVTGGWNNVGGLVGYNDRGEIQGCYSRGGVTGEDYAGGLVGYNYSGDIKGCYSTGTITGRYHIGGLVGLSRIGDIKESYSTSGVTGQKSVGGLVGYNYSGDIKGCYSTGSVTGNSDVGGLVGSSFSHGEIQGSYSTGDVTGENDVGGLAGYSSGDITSCYSTGKVTGGGDYVGGLVGNNSGDIKVSYSTGSVSGEEEVGGLVGSCSSSAAITSSFWDIETSGLLTSAGGIGLPTALMQMKSTFEDAGWDFDTPIWTIDDGNDYPRLWWENVGPVACIVGGDRVVEAGEGCEAAVVLDGSCSSDADSTEGTNDDIVSFEWYLVDSCDPSYEDYLGSGEVIDVNLPLGENIIVLEVTDTAGAFDSNEVVITVEDVTAPEFILTVEPEVLKPHNHEMVLITPVWETSDNCDEEVEVSLLSITSSQGEDGIGDGHTTEDILVTEEGLIYLRAEIGDSSEDRIYTLTFEAVDDSGNSNVQSAIVVVAVEQLWRHRERYSGDK